MNPEILVRKVKEEAEPAAEKLPVVNAAEIRQAGQPNIETFYSGLVKKFDIILQAQAPEEPEDDDDKEVYEASYARNVAQVNLQRLELDDQAGMIQSTIQRVHLIASSSLNDPGYYFIISYKFVPNDNPADHIYVDTEEFRPRRLMYDKEQNSQKSDSLAMPLEARAYQLRETLSMIDKAAGDAELNPQFHTAVEESEK